MAVVPSLPDVEKWETDAAQAHMPSRHQMGLPDPPSYMRSDMDRLVDLYFNEPMPDWLFAGMGVLGSKHLQRYMMKCDERLDILVRWTGDLTNLKCNWLTGNTFSMYSRSRRRHFMFGIFHTKNPALCQTELRHRLRRLIASTDPIDRRGHRLTPRNGRLCTEYQSRVPHIHMWIPFA
jgi:hypothetical protein